jgi:hypothetical protein
MMIDQNWPGDRREGRAPASLQNAQGTLGFECFGDTIAPALAYLCNRLPTLTGSRPSDR